MFAHRLVVDALYRFLVSLIVLVAGCFQLGYMASYSVLWWFLGSIMSVFLLEDCVLKWVYLRRQMNYTENGRPYPHFLTQLAELYPNYIYIPEDNDIPPDNHEEPLV
jgi:hypothetical protein